MDNAIPVRLERQSVGNPVEEPPGALLGFDAFDGLPLRTLEEFGERAEQTLKLAATALADQGAGGPAMRRLLVRDVLTSKTCLRFVQGARNVELRRVLRGKSESDRRLRLLEHIVAQEHRRMMTSIEMLTRIDCAAPSVSITAGQAAVVVGGQR